jgi:hypothetical protein
MTMKTLSDISTEKLAQAEVAGLARVHLWVTGEMHRLVDEYASLARSILLKRGGKEGVLDGASGYQAQTDLLKAWGNTFADLTRLMLAGRKNAATLPYMLQGETWNRLAKNPALDMSEIKRIDEAVGAAWGGWVDTQLRILLDAAGSTVLEDGLNLSGHVWKLERSAREGIGQAVMAGIADKRSAWQVAEDLEQFLGANQDCPRWTSGRLYGLTKKEIASGNLSGLVTGKSCDGQGVAYDALRLARTEIQRAHAEATDRMLKASPWVLQEKFNLSEAHSSADACDDYAKGGENGDGVYPVGETSLPVHPNCLCYKTAVTMSDAEFIQGMRGWMSGTSAWPAMDDFARSMGESATTISAAGVTVDLLTQWLFGDEGALGKLMK